MIYLSKKTKIVLGIILLILSVALAVSAIFWSNNLDHSTYDYNELTYREFSVQSIKKATGRNARYEIYTNEEELPLVISEINFGVVNHENMDSLQQGDKIFCYIDTAPTKAFSYGIAELQTESQVILSLKDYNISEIKNQKVGCNLIGATSILFFCLSISDFITVIIDKRKNRY